MRFFTKEWLRGELTDAAYDAVPAKYRLHVAQLRLPPDVFALSQADVHDGLMLGVLDEPKSAQLTLWLRCGELQQGYFDLHIKYTAAAVDGESLSALRDAMKMPKDEVLYDEVDRAGDRFEHRLILSSHRQAYVTFTGVGVSSRPAAGRETV